MRVKKLIFLGLLLFLTFSLYSQDITEIDIDEYLLDGRITSFLYEEVVQAGDQNSLHIYQQNNVVYVLGWSKDGKMAFLSDKAVDGRGGHDFFFTILDLVTDEQTYYKKIRWYDYDAYGEEDIIPLTFQDCINNNADEFNTALRENGIILSPVQVKDLPACDANGSEVTFGIREQKVLSDRFPSEMSFDVWAFKDGKKKLVASVKDKPGEYVKLTGYIKSPYEERIALILADAEYVYEGDEVFVNFYGCSLNYGFVEE